MHLIVVDSFCAHDRSQGCKVYHIVYSFVPTKLLLFTGDGRRLFTIRV